jgi:hypothetical protein
VTHVSKSCRTSSSSCDEEQLDRLLEVVHDVLGKPFHRRHEVGDPGPFDVLLELAVPVIGVRVDGEDSNALAGARAEPEADRRLALPRADLDDHAPPRAVLRELVERLAFLVGEPAGDVLDQLFDRSEVAHVSRS